MTEQENTSAPSLASRVAAIAESAWVNNFLTLLILANAFSMAFQTYTGAVAAIDQRFGIRLESWFSAFDAFVLVIFTIDVGVRIALEGKAFFKEPWNVFDAAVVALSLIGQTPLFAVLRVLRVLRLLRLLKQIESLRLISSIIVKSTTGCLSISFLMVVVLFIFALAGHSLYGTTHPEIFGELHTAMYTMFRVAAYYSVDEVAAVLVKEHPYVYLFLVPYFFGMSYVIMNFFCAIVVYYLYEMSFEDIKAGKVAEAAAEEEAAAQQEAAEPALAAGASEEQFASLMAELARLRQEVQTLKASSA